MTVSNAAGQHTLRERNLALVAAEVFSAPEPLSRATIASRTGLTRATVSSLVDLLVDAQIVAELAPVISRKAGRPAVPLTPATGTYFGLGLEVNVSYLSGVVVDLTSTEVAHLTIPGDFRGSSPEQVMTQLGGLAVQLVEQALASVRAPGRDEPRIAGVNLALPGLIDPNRSSLRVAPNLGWQNLDPVDTTPISTALARALGYEVSVAIGNEANFGGLAQIALGGLTTFIYVSAEVGIGSAIVLDRELFLGRRGWSGELGHVTVDPAGPECRCGSRGCLEQYAGLAALMSGAGLPLDGGVDQLVARLEIGDELAGQAVERAGVALGSALADFINLIDIHMVVLGGIYQDLSTYLVPIIQRTLADHVLSARWSTFEVIGSPVGRGAALLGAATDVTRSVWNNPSQWITDATS